MLNISKSLSWIQNIPVIHLNSALYEALILILLILIMCFDSILHRFRMNCKGLVLFLPWKYIFLNQYSYMYWFHKQQTVIFTLHQVYNVWWQLQYVRIIKRFIFHCLLRGNIVHSTYKINVKWWGLILWTHSKLQMLESRGTLLQTLKCRPKM